jgi:hypothetical protein
MAATVAQLPNRPGIRQQNTLRERTLVILSNGLATGPISLQIYPRVQEKEYRCPRDGNRRSADHVLDIAQSVLMQLDITIRSSGQAHWLDK